MPKIENTSANVQEMLKRGGAVDQVIKKVGNIKVELEGIKYYGDSNIIPSDDIYTGITDNHFSLYALIVSFIILIGAKIKYARK